MAPQDLDPIQLIQKIVDKDGKAFDCFYERYSSLVFSMALRVLKSQSDAEELTQDIFYRVWTEAVKYTPKRGKPEAWLIMMTRSRAIDKLRSRQRKSRNTQSLEHSPEVAQETSVRSQVDAQISMGGILEQLPGPQKIVLDLAYFKGLTQSEIAVQLDTPLGTVKTRMRDGIKRLREFLKAKEKSGAL